MKRKILLINTTFEGGGAAGVARNIFYDLNKDDLDIHFAYGRGKNSEEDKTFKFGNIIETPIHFFLVRFLGLEGCGSYFSTKKLINHIKKEKFDLINFHNLHGYYLNFYNLIDFLKQANIPIIWTLHDEWALNPILAHSVKGYSYPKTYNKIFLNFFFSKKRKLFANILNLTIVCPTRWQVEKIRDSYLKDHNIRLIHNGINTNLFKPVLNKENLREKYRLPIDKKIILFSATNFKDENKGTKYIIDVAINLKEYFFLGVGKGNLPAIENIKVMSYIKDREVLAELYALSDMFCITSLAETQPLVVLEAMASGLPVVGFYILGLREIINKEVGSLVPVADLKKLAEAIVANTGRNQITKARNARELAICEFSLECSLSNYKSLYYEILK